MNNHRNRTTVLVADDDEDDRLITQKVWEKTQMVHNLFFVEDGEELLDFLYHRGKYAASANYPLPNLILLDLNMPRKDGREALKEIKSAPELRHIPVVVLTTSQEEEDIARSYDLGANSYITKPVTYKALNDVIKTLDEYWFSIVKLPVGNVDDAKTA